MITGQHIRRAIKSSDVSLKEVSEKLNMTRQGLEYHLNKEKPDRDFITNVQSLLGISIEDRIENKPSTEKGVPFYDVSASAGLTLGQLDGVSRPTGNIIIPGFEDCNVAVPVFGDSMYPKFCSGEIIVCKSVILDERLTYVRFGEAYLCNLDDGLVLKYLDPGEDKDHLTLRSENPKNAPYQVHKSRFKTMWIVKGVINRKIN